MAKNVKCTIELDLSREQYAFLMREVERSGMSADQYVSLQLSRSLAGELHESKRKPVEGASRLSDLRVGTVFGPKKDEPEIEGIG